MLYFAYGSNLHHFQMKRRCKDSVYLKKINLKNFKLTFRSKYRAADIEPKKNSIVPGGLFEISKSDEKKLDVYEDYPILYKIQKKTMLQGRFINQNDISEKRKVAVVSNDIYKQLFEKDENSIGNYIQINSTNFKVIGVFQEQDVNMCPSSDVHIPFTTFQQLYNTGDRVGWMVITGKSDYNIRQIEEDVKLLLRNLNKIHPRDNRALGSFNLGKEFAKITGFLTGMQFLTWFVGIATLIAGVFAIGNILLITVKERTKEIGIRRAIGATPIEIRRQVVLESVFLTTVAGMLGIIFGGFVLFLMDTFLGSGPDPTLINPTVNIPIILFAFLILIVLGTLIGLIPAYMATLVKPIDALRDE